MATSDGPKDLPKIDLPDDWELNTFLLEVSEMLEEGDLRKMKSLCSGRGGFGRGVLERLASPLDFFDFLRQTERLTRHNLLFLQALIWSVGRKDIHKKFVAFGREMKEALHFFAPKDKPENGYMHLKFHVGGDTQNFSTKSLKDLQAYVSRLLRVPEHFVYVGGIEPSNSLLITFIVPEDLVYIILELTEDEKNELMQYGIDNIVVEDKVLSLKGKVPSDSFLHESMENKKLLEKELKQEKEIESLQIKLLQANETLNRYKNEPRLEANVWLVWLLFLYKLHCDVMRSRKVHKVPSCKVLAAQLIQRRMLRRTRELGYDETIIAELMCANSTITMEYVDTKMELTTTAMLHMIETLRNENCMLQYCLEKMMFFCGVKDDERILSERDEFFLCHMLQGHPIGLKVEIVEKLDPGFVTQVLRSLSKKMTKIERRKILNNSKLSSEETAFVRAHPDQLLMAVLNKETEESEVNISSWLKKTLQPLGNENLVQKGLEMMNPHTKANKSGQSKRKGGGTVGPDKPTTKGEHEKGQSSKKSSINGQGNNSTSKSGFSGEEPTQNSEELKEKMDKMLQMMMTMQEDIDDMKLKNESGSSLTFPKNERKLPDLLGHELISKNKLLNPQKLYC